MSNISKLISSILSNSDSPEWEEARLEWNLSGIARSSKNACLCGAAIKNVFTIYNRYTHASLEVGSECVKNINHEYLNIFKYISSINENHSKRPNDFLIEYCWKNQLICLEQYQFSKLLEHKVSLERFPDLLNIRKQINQTILSKILNSDDTALNHPHEDLKTLQEFLKKNTKVINKLKLNHESLEQKPLPDSEQSKAEEHINPLEANPNLSVNSINISEPPSPPSSKKITEITLTSEQKKIIDSQANILIINAFAGTGKTSTLVAYAKSEPSWKILYIAYNRMMREEAERKFPNHVICKTLHSLAFDALGNQYASKIGNNRILEIADAIGVKYDNVQMIKNAIDLLQCWFNSSRLVLDTNLYEEYYFSLSQDAKEEIHPATFKHILRRANEIWSCMLDKANNKVKMPHDGYLKLYHLSGPIFNYDCIMLDEAQDSNDVTVSIIESSKCANKVIVGDMHQSIYQFRGTKNALDDFFRIAQESSYLTNSFRFNSKIATYASNILNMFKGESNRIKGLSSNEGNIYKHSAKITKLPRYTTILSRKNASLFLLAIESLKEGKRVHFLGGIKKYDLNLIKSISLLEIGKIDKNKFTHEFIRRFSSLTQLEIYSSKAKEQDLTILVKFIKSHGGANTISLVDELVKYDEWVLSNYRSNIRDCDYLLTTAHRSKGLEFKNVAIWNDFEKLYDYISDGFDTRYIKKQLQDKEKIDYEQEANLYYVAATRTQNNLFLVNNPLFQLKPNMHKFEELS